MSVVSVNMTALTTSAAPGDNSATNTGAASAGIASALIFVIVFVVVIIVRKKMSNHNKERGSTSMDEEEDSEVSPFSEGGKSGVERGISVTSSKSLKMPLWKDVDHQLKAVISTLAIDSDRLTVGRQLGKGQFGMVYEAALSKDRRSNDYGPLTHSKVAVKSLKGDNLTKDNIESFLREGLIMKDFHHKNVLQLIGVALADQGMPLIVLPYMAKGNLKKYIMKPQLKITVRELLQLGLQVAHGMAYLETEKFVHRDLAARNCMIDENMIVKVADFGLSRDIYTKDYYASENTQIPLPVKWMALESLMRALYTSKSDVWSYGVLLWELLTRGALPYPDVANWEVRAYVQAGNRLEQPPESPQQIYDLMLQCWDKTPELRPDFREIIVVMDNLLRPHSNGADDEEDDEGEYENSDSNLYMNIRAAEGASSADVTGASDVTDGIDVGIAGLKKKEEQGEIQMKPDQTGSSQVKYTAVTMENEPS